MRTAVDDLKNFCCQNPDCPDYGQRGLDNLRVCFHNGPHKQRRVLACRTCQQRFSERKGTALYRCKLPEFVFRRFQGVPAAVRRVHFLPAMVQVSKCFVGRRPSPIGSARAAEKLDDLGEPGFQATRLGMQLFGFLFVTDAAQRGQEISEGGFLLALIPAAAGKA